MTRGKAHTCPNIVIGQAIQPKHRSRDEAWAVVGPAIARILAQAILAGKQEQPKRIKRKGKVASLTS